MGDFSDAPSLRESPLVELERSVVAAAVALSSVYAEFDGQPDCIGERLEVLWSVCEKLRLARVADFVARQMPNTPPGYDGHEFSDGYKRGLAESNRKDGSSPQNNDPSDLLIEHKRRAF